MGGEGRVSAGTQLEKVGYWVCDLEGHLVCGLFLSLSLSWLLGEELLCSVIPSTMTPGSLQTLMQLPWHFDSSQTLKQWHQGWWTKISETAQKQVFLLFNEFLQRFFRAGCHWCYMHFRVKTEMPERLYATLILVLPWCLMQLATGLFRPVVYEVILYMKSMFNGCKTSGYLFLLEGTSAVCQF